MTIWDFFSILDLLLDIYLQNAEGIGSKYFNVVIYQYNKNVDIKFSAHGAFLE